MALVPEYKIILLGEPGVGKTSCFYRIRDDVFIGSSSVSTVGTGVESLVQSVDVDGQEVKVGRILSRRTSTNLSFRTHVLDQVTLCI